ncbi:HAD-IIB family hydrolase [Holdemania massiliensis]|uniref:HAD-IIB family hydrolase n=1 Tax=Holdemania massiliensis TaxID=1468449 RepID=UPI001F06C1AA|nr:HAD-IIB family hydrolase [Holdemania massiliensis]MCH1942392.1 HAD family hydrolase [Holdemania massiliensis]
MDDCCGIIFDLDETLLHKDKSISSNTVGILKQIHLNKNLFFASGRSVMRMKKYSDLVLPDGLISLNGALNFYQGKLISSYFIEPDIIEKTVRYLIDKPNVNIALTYAERILTNDPEICEIDPTYIFSDFKNYDSSNVLKISLDLEDEKLLDQLDLDVDKVKIIANSHTPGYFVIVNILATKYRGLKDICDQLSMEVKKFIYFGDDYNDEEIMQQVGIGIAVENATSEIKKIAYDVCASNDQDGPAEWIKKNLL